MRLSRKVKGTPKNVTISRCGKHWYVAIQVEEEIALKKAPESPIGIDLGVADIAEFSDGTRIKTLDLSKEERLRKGRPRR